MLKYEVKIFVDAFQPYPHRPNRMYYLMHDNPHRINGPAGLWADGSVFWKKYDYPRIWNL